MIIIPKNIKALIFDLDGTLADTMPIHLKSWTRTGKDLGVEITEELIQINAGMPTLTLVEKFNREFGWNLNGQDVRKTKQHHFDAIKKEQGKIQPIKKIFELAQSMRTQMPMSIGTGSSRNNALKSLEDLGTSDWWVTVVTGSDDVKGKPSPDIFLKCSDAMKTDPKDCLVFEDGQAGIQSAISAGMPYIDVNIHL